MEPGIWYMGCDSLVDPEMIDGLIIGFIVCGSNIYNLDCSVSVGTSELDYIGIARK